MVIKSVKKQLKEQAHAPSGILSSEELARLTARLEDEERDVRASLATAEAMVLGEPFDESRMRYEPDYQMALQQRLEQIQEALLRRRQGNYGLCVECGNRIEKNRLAADPAVSRCLNCQKVVEISATN